MSGLIIEPEIVADERKAKERARQLERRGIARDLLPSIIGVDGDFDEKVDVGIALEYADELLAQTKVE